MDKKLKAKWVKALRSGKYKQGMQALYQEGSYCCLGVLSCIATGKRGRAGAYSAKGGYDLADKVLGDAKSQRLQTMNDGGCTFTEIADYIEERL